MRRAVRLQVMRLKCTDEIYERWTKKCQTKEEAAELSQSGALQNALGHQ